MIEPVRVTVIFACPRCATAYSAVQRVAFDFGSFDCWDCQTEIYRWAGEYKYDDWEQITGHPAGNRALAELVASGRTVSALWTAASELERTHASRLFRTK